MLVCEPNQKRNGCIFKKVASAKSRSFLFGKRRKKRRCRPCPRVENTERAHLQGSAMVKGLSEHIQANRNRLFGNAKEEMSNATATVCQHSPRCPEFNDNTPSHHCSADRVLYDDLF